MRNLKLPEREEKQSVTVQVETALLDRVKHHARARGVSLRQAFEYGLRRYVDDCETLSTQMPLPIAEDDE